MPGALVLVVGGLVASALLDLGAHGVALVGPVPRGLPAAADPVARPGPADLPEIVISAVALLLIGFSQTAGDARAFATRHRYRIDVNQESVAQGMANLGAGVFQGMPVSTSLSASSLNESAGARTPVASLATGAFVLATLILLAPLFSDLPKAVLAAIIIDAVVFGMIDVAELRRLRRVKRFDFWIAMAALLGVLSAGVLLGVVIGIVLSLGWLVYVATSPSMPLLGREAGTQVFRDLDEHPEDETHPGVAVLRIDGGLFFATAEAVDERVRAITDGHPGLRTLVLDLEGVNFVDAQGAAKLTEIHGLAEADGLTLRLARVKPDVLAVLRAEGFLDADRPRPRARQRPPGRRGGRHLAWRILMPVVLIVLIVAAKFGLPVLIVWFPFAAGWANFFLDGFDGDLLIPLGLPNDIYQPVDKVTDWVTYVAIVVVAFRNGWPTKRLMLGLFLFRSVGQVASWSPGTSCSWRLPELPRAAVPRDRDDPGLGAQRAPRSRLAGARFRPAGAPPLARSGR